MTIALIEYIVIIHDRFENSGEKPPLDFMAASQTPSFVNSSGRAMYNVLAARSEGASIEDAKEAIAPLYGVDPSDVKHSSELNPSDRAMAKRSSMGYGGKNAWARCTWDPKKDGSSGNPSYN